MRTDRQLTALFESLIVDERADPTFLDELFELLVEEVASVGPAATRRPRAVTLWSRAPRWPLLVAASLVVATLTFAVLLRAPIIGPPRPTPTRTALPSASDRITPSTTLAPFVSSTYGYTIAYPSNWKTVPSTSRLDSTAYPQNGSSTVDFFSAGPPGVGDPGLTVAGPAVPHGTSLVTWTASIQRLQANGFTCPPATALEPIQVGGQPAQLLTWANCPVWLMWAGVVQGGQAFHVIFSDRYAANDNALQASDRALFLRILGTATFTISQPSPPVTPSSTLVPFTSSTYGYSLSYPSNWGTRPATATHDRTIYPTDTDASVDYFSASAPAQGDPGLIVAGAIVPGTTTLADWTAAVQQLQAGAGFTCPPPQASEPLQIGGEPAELMTWTSCPVWLLWGAVVHGDRAYHLIFIDDNATNDPARQATDKALFLRILGSVTFTTAPTGSPAPS
jgi:hypothetical protein